MEAILVNSIQHICSSITIPHYSETLKSNRSATKKPFIRHNTDPRQAVDNDPLGVELMMQSERSTSCVALTTSEYFYDKNCLPPFWGISFSSQIHRILSNKVKYSITELAKRLDGRYVTSLQRQHSFVKGRRVVETRIDSRHPPS